MVKQFHSFSPCGKSFVYCCGDGKLKLWDTLSGVLKQEFVPNLHLTQPCTSLVWLRFSKSLVVSRKKKRKSDGRGSDSLGLGTNNGVVAIYNINEGNITCSLQGGHSTSVSCLAWSSAYKLLSASDNTVVVWDLENKCVKSKWKCGKGKITCLEVSNDGETCITGSFKIRVWNVLTKGLVKELTGHSGEVTNIRFINDTNFFLSTSTNDQYVSVWNLADQSSDPVGKFVLSDDVHGDISTIDSSGSVRLASSCSSGVLHYFNHQFNGSVCKAVKPVYRIEVASSGPIENGSSSPISHNKSADTSAGNEVSRLPIVAVHLISPTSATIAYGLAPSFTFETIELKENKEILYLVRELQLKKSTTNYLSKDGSEVTVDDAEYISGGIIGGGKRSRDSNGREVPLEQRLTNLSMQDLTAAIAEQDSTSPNSMVQLLSQALQSKDKALLETVLFRKEVSVVRQTVSKLPVNLIPSLVRELTTMIQGKTLTSSIAVVWLHCLLSMHSSQLLADEQSLSLLSSLHSLVETRLCALPRLFRLSGRLDLLLQLIRGQATSVETDQPALLVYQDEESSDEGSSVGGDAPDVPSDSEDKWDELSDLDTEDMST